MVEVLTDNRTRAAADIRSYFSKADGNLGANGCVGYSTTRVFWLSEESAPNEDEVMMQALEAGAEDFISEDGYYEIYTAVADFAQSATLSLQTVIPLKSQSSGSFRKQKDCRRRRRQEDGKADRSPGRPR